MLAAMAGLRIFGDLGADELVGVVGDLGRGGEAGADGPDGLVGDDERRGDGGVDAFEADGELLALRTSLVWPDFALGLCARRRRRWG